MVRPLSTTRPRRTATTRSALLLLPLTLLLAFLACVLVVGEARTALAQAAGPALTGYCVSTDTEQSITVQGTGWTPGSTVRIFLDGSGSPINYTTADVGGYITHRFDSPGFVPGRTVTIAAQPASDTFLVPDEPGDTPGPASISTTVTCAAPPDTAEPQQPTPQPATQVTPELTVSCDPAQGVTFRGTGWRTGAFVQLYGYTKQATGTYYTELSGTAIPTEDGVITGRVLDYDPGLYVSLTATFDAPQDQGGAQVTGQTTCPESPGGGTTSPGGGGDQGGDQGGGSGGGSSSGVIATAGNVFSGLLAGQLPDTGGGWAILLVAGAILIALGWLLVRLARRLAAAR